MFPTLFHFPKSLKFALTVYLFLVSLGFGTAALMSQSRYHFDHQKTVEYYRGNENDSGEITEIQIAKPYTHLIAVTHVHSLMFPVVFLTLWGLFSFSRTRALVKNTIVLSGALSILAYNAAPYLVRFVSPRFASLFTVGGLGMFASFLIPAALVVYELWWGRAQKPSI